MDEFNPVHNEMERFLESVRVATQRLLAEGIEANSILINENMVKVPETWLRTPVGPIALPPMICGLNIYVTQTELPDRYSFAVFETRSDRLAQYESIGMNPDELRKAAEIYKKIKEIDI